MSKLTIIESTFSKIYITQSGSKSTYPSKLSLISKRQRNENILFLIELKRHILASQQRWRLKTWFWNIWRLPIKQRYTLKSINTKLLSTAGQSSLTSFMELLFSMWSTITQRTANWSKMLSSRAKEKQQLRPQGQHKSSEYRLMVCILQNSRFNFSYLDSTIFLWGLEYQLWSIVYIHKHE